MLTLTSTWSYHIKTQTYIYILQLLPVLQKAFNSFAGNTGSISTETVAEILRLMGQAFNQKILDEMIEEVDEDSK